jgi:hypothetical protein
MIQINFCQPSSIILADLQRHVVMDGFLQAALRAGGVELQWEYLGEVAANEEGVMVYVSLGRRLTKAEFVGQLAGGTDTPTGHV